VKTKDLLWALTLGLLMTAIGSTYGAMTFDFSYTFDNSRGMPGTASGTLTGVQVGNTTSGYITDVSVQSLFINGVQVPGPIYSYFNLYGQGVPVVSFLALQNSFVFINSDYGNGNYGYSGYSNLDGDYGHGTWSLTPVPVPESSPFIAGVLMLLLFALEGLRGLRHLKNVA
jgi:hypothetical protein